MWDGRSIQHVHRLDDRQDHTTIITNQTISSYTYYHVIYIDFIIDIVSYSEHGYHSSKTLVPKKKKTLGSINTTSKCKHQ